MAKKDKKSKKVDTSWEDELGEAPPTATTNDDAPPAAASPAEESGPQAPEEGNMDEEFGGGLLGAIRANRNKKKGKQAKEEAAPPEEEKEDGDIKIKSKKEKEKEKKEREKQRKKEQAARKKTTAPTPAPAKAASPAAVEEEKKPAAPAPEPKAPAGKKGKAPSAAIAALRKQQEERKRLEEEQQRLIEEQKRLEEEERKRLEEEERKKEEARQRKKEKEKEKREQLRKEGKLLTKAQQEAQKRNQLRLQQMIDAGIIVEGLEKKEGEASTKKKPTFDRKKKKPGKGPSAAEQEAKAAEEKRLEEERLAAEAKKKAEEEEAARKKAEEEAAAAKAAEESDLEDDWEAALEKEEKAAAVKESWEDSTDEEEESKKAVTPSKAAGKQPAKKVKESEEEDSEEDSEDEDLTQRQKMELKRKEDAAARRQKQLEEAKAAASKDDLRSPICCILGHVDTGKTKLLDKIRQTNVQEGEAGGITQQIGATYFPVEAIKQKTQVVNQDDKLQFKIPGLLIIDTPGHESFTNLRSRGSSLCNIAILVVDIMHGLEPQTLESIRLLKDRKTPFIVALNKIDRLYDWQAVPNNGFLDSLSKQKKSVQAEFRDRLQKTIIAFAEQGLNAALFSENKNQAKFVSLVPTSAHTGEGIPDLLKLLTQLTQERMVGKLMYLSSLECTVLEVKVIEGLGTTIDVILSNGVLREGDRIVLCGLNGPIATNVRALLTPQPLRELRVKSQYVHHKEVKAALGVKIAANDLENAIAGSRLLVVGPDDDEEDLEDDVMGDLEGLLSKISTTGKGVCVQASTLGSLEALLEFLRTSKIPVMSISIGPVYKRDVMKAVPMLEKNKEFAVMLCFDVKVDKEAQQYADEMGVKIFTADIIYHLFDSFTAYQREMLEAKRREASANAVFPCILKPVHVFNKKDPIVVGVDVIEGSLRVGTPIVALKTNAAGERDVVVLGRVTSIRLNETNLTTVKKGHPSVAMKVEGPNQPLYGRQLDEKDILYSHISRLSIDTLKEFFRDQVTKEDWALIVKLKGPFGIS